jgi:predicted DNA-binding transcriptional regulator YafY
MIHSSFGATLHIVLPTPARLLRLLALLQAQRDWTGPQLAERLEVTTRTVRNDVERLRSLGYPVHSTLGVTGGYRLGAGAALPPLLLDDDEAVAVAVGLRTAAGGSVSGIEETSLRALAKLEQVLPSRLRHRVSALHSSTISIAGPSAAVAADVLSTIAAAIRATVSLRFDYASFDGSPSRRMAEPHQLVHTRGRWLLVAWDVDRRDWRTFRVDRMRLRSPNGARFRARQVPGGDVAAYVERNLGSAMWRFRARVKVHASAADVAAHLPPALQVEPLDSHTCLVHMGSDSARMLAVWVGLLDVDFEVEDCPELAEELRQIAARYLRAVGPPPRSA